LGVSERVQTSAHEGIVTLGLGGARLGAVAGSGGRRYARAMKMMNVGGNGSCPKCGSEPGTNIDCTKCDPKTETMAGNVAGPVKQGATHASTGGTGTGNIATAPVPIGTTLRRVSPHLGGKRKKKKKKRREEQATRLMVLASLTG
jgi:hypothetical protein